MSHLTEDDLRDALHGASPPELAVDTGAARRTGRRRVLVRRATNVGVLAGVTAAVVAVVTVVPGLARDPGPDRPETHVSRTATPTATASADPRTPRLPHATATHSRGRRALDTGLTIDGHPIVIGPDGAYQGGVSIRLAGPQRTSAHRLNEDDIGDSFDRRADGYGLRTTFVETCRPGGDTCVGHDGRYVAWALLPKGASAPVFTYGRYGHGPRAPRTAPLPQDPTSLQAGDPETVVAIAVVRSTQYDWPYEPVDGDGERMPVTKITYTGADGARHVIKNGTP